MFKKYVTRIRRSEYFGNLSVQLTGTFVAQIIPIAFSPLLSRLYQQDAFAALTLFMAIVGILSVPNAGRYHIAIVKPKDEKEAEGLFELSIVTTVIYNAFLLVLILVGYSFFNKYYKLDFLWYLVPVTVFLYGVYNSELFYSIRNKFFLKNAKAKISQTIVNSIVSIIIVYFGFKIYGLVIGRVLGIFAGSLVLFRAVKFKINVSNLKSIGKKYIEYPKLTIVPTLMNIFSAQALVLYVGLFFSDKILGNFGLANIILVAPIALIGVSYRDVFYQKVTELYNQNKLLEVKRIYIISALCLFVLAAGLCIILFFYGEYLFSFIYGVQWKESGKYASILVFATAIKLVASPLSIILNTTNKLKWLAIWQTLYFISLNLTLYISIIELGLNIENVFFIYVIHEVLLYTLYLFLQYFSIPKINLEIDCWP